MGHWNPVEIIDKTGRILGIFDCGTFELPSQQRDRIINIPVRKPTPTRIDFDEAMKVADASISKAVFKWHPVRIYKKDRRGEPYEVATHWYLMTLDDLSPETWHGEGFIAFQFDH